MVSAFRLTAGMAFPAWPHACALTLQRFSKCSRKLMLSRTFFSIKNICMADFPSLDRPFQMCDLLFMPYDLFKPCHILLQNIKNVSSTAFRLYV